MSGPYQALDDNNWQGPSTEALVLAVVFIAAVGILFGLHAAFRGSVQF